MFIQGEIGYIFRNFVFYSFYLPLSRGVVGSVKFTQFMKPHPRPVLKIYIMSCHLRFWQWKIWLIIPLVKFPIPILILYTGRDRRQKIGEVCPPTLAWVSQIFFSNLLGVSPILFPIFWHIALVILLSSFAVIHHGLRTPPKNSYHGRVVSMRLAWAPQ